MARPGGRERNENKYWQPSQAFRTAWASFSAQAVRNIGGPYASKLFAESLRISDGALRNFLNGKKPGGPSHVTTADRTSRNLISGLRHPSPRDRQNELPEDYVCFFSKSRQTREALADLLEEERRAAMDPASAALGIAAAPQGAVHNVALPGPRLPRVVEVHPQLGETGNAGTPETPELLVRLKFGRGDSMLDDGASEATLRLANCVLKVDFKEGELVEPEFSSETSFRLTWAEGGSAEIRFYHDGEGTWATVPAASGRRLFGQSGYEFLCAFNSRPKQLDVRLYARAHDFRLDRPASHPSPPADAVSKVIAYLASRGTLGEPDGAGYYCLDQKAVLP